MCWLAAEDPWRVVHHLKNERTGLLMSVLAVVEDDSAPLDGSAAEWIVERPTHQETHELYPFPASDPVMFRDCGAEAARDGRLAPARTERDLQGATLIRMARTFPELARTSVVAEPKTIGDASLLIIRRPDAPWDARPVERKVDRETGSDVAPAPANPP